MLTKPLKGMKPSDITQGYHSGHKALDIIGNGSWSLGRFSSTEGYGECLAAPEDVEIISITGASPSATVKGSTKHGYGVFMKGLETGYTHLFWHTLPILPVEVGQIVPRGKIVAFMGNTGLVYKNGKYVPLDVRNKDLDAGTHLHWELLGKTYVLGKNKPLINPTPLIDWRLEPNYTLSTFARKGFVVVLKMKSLLKNLKKI